MVQCIAHRGWSGRAPENTLAAFELAWNSPDVDGIELDVHLSRDNVPVVIHDQTVKRTTNGKKAVRDYTVNELKTLDAGSWFNEQFAGQRIPTLEDVLRRMNRKKSLTIELKQRRDIYPGLEEKIVRLLHKYEITGSTLVGSFDHTAVKKIKQMDASIQTGLIFMNRPVIPLEQMEEAGAEVMMLYHEMAGQGIVDMMLYNGYKVNVWTVNKQHAVERLRLLSQELIITTNHPGMVREKQKHKKK
ncbi:glycerophosphodiester phosphodiesterase [Salibacterium lacus]|uniref:Glycerophosphodiester phosphodiesterase n=1 Tax=Salibacterium lacus TaxID=1898109 RepID=A0ABW5T546_9BACI